MHMVEFYVSSKPQSWKYLTDLLYTQGVGGYSILVFNHMELDGDATDEHFTGISKQAF